MLKIDVTKKYALAVSGGVDSMVMLDAFANHLPRPNFFVVTVNHGIRKSAQGDCQFVENYCKNIGVKCKTFVVDAPAHAKQNKLSLETSARILRYQIFEKVECDYLCLAHHQSDNAETVLLHILRGSGTNGAQGIKQYNGRYFRPLLNLTKQQILQHAKDNNLPFVQDETNDCNDYTRNYLRNKVIPLLNEIFPNVEQNLARFAQSACEDESFLQSLADISAVEFLDNQAKIPLELFNQPQPLVYRLLKKVFEKLGVFNDVEKVHYQSISALAKNVGGKEVCLPFDFVAINDYHFVTVCKRQSSANCQWQIPFAVGVTQTPFGVVTVSPTPLPDALRFDITKIPPTAVFRPRQSGDIFCKFGGGTKPLKSYLIDKKIPQRMRDNLTLLADGNQILIVLGVEIADNLRTTSDSNVYYVKMD